MSFDAVHTIESIQEGTKEVAETAHVKTSEFHEKYISKVVPDCGKYGDAARFVAEMAPGVSEYNAIREGDWQGFAISAGIDVAAFAIGAVTLGTGYGAVKGGSVAAKTGVKAATREIAEAGAKKAAKEIAKEGAEKAIKETAEAGAKRIVKEAAEAGTEKAVKEIAEAGAEKAAKEVAEAGAEKVAKEVAEAGAEKAVKEVTEAGTEKATKEIAEAGSKKVVKETAEKGGEKLASETTEKVAKSVKEVGEKIDKTLVPDYFHEVEKITNTEIPPNQMEKLQEALRKQDFAKLDSDAVRNLRRDFNKIKGNLIAKWEENLGKKWPVYTEDVLNDAGVVVRKAGQPFDAHHLIELSFGGPNDWWNLHPAAFPAEHPNAIHAATSLANTIFGR